MLDVPTFFLSGSLIFRFSCIYGAAARVAQLIAISTAFLITLLDTCSWESLNMIGLEAKMKKNRLSIIFIFSEVQSSEITQKRRYVSVKPKRYNEESKKICFI